LFIANGLPNRQKECAFSILVSGLIFYLIQDRFVTIKKIRIMARYSKGASKKVEEAMHEMKEGDLRTGTGKKVTSRKQAIAIGLSEARDEGKKVPKKDKDDKKKKR